MKTKQGKIRFFILIILLFVCLVISAVFAVSIGSSKLEFGTVYRILTDQLFFGGRGLEAGAYEVAWYHVVWDIRLPRVLFGLLCGSGLSVCGAVMQSLVMNPIADPYILGISSGASAGAAWALLMPLPFFAGQYQVTAAALAGALLSSLAVYTMASAGSHGQIKPVTLILAGTAVNAVMSAITSLLIFLAKSPESIAAVYNWQMGSLASAQWSTLMFPTVGVLAGTVIFTMCGKQLNLLMMGDEDAMSMGLHVKQFRTFMFVLCALVVASLVSVTGIIGFVGLTIPHIVRILGGSSNNVRVIPLCALLGGIFLIWADAAARGLWGSAELPIGIVTAFVGAPFFMYLLIRKNYGGTGR